MSKNSSEVMEILKRVGALITDSHIVGASGRHMSAYINKDAIYPHTAEASRIGEFFAENHKDLNIEAVVGPALGGIILSQWTAYHLSRIKGKEIFGVYTEKDRDSNQIFTRGYDKLILGRKILVVEDITTTGGSAKKVVEAVKATGGRPIAVSVIVNREPERVNSETMGAPFTALSEFPAESYEERDCPLCRQGVPINTAVGHGKKYLEGKK